MEPVEVLKLLGIGWGVYELYPNPTNQRAFASAIERLAPLQDQVTVFEIGAGKITCEGEVVELAQGGSERLALRLFIHEVEWLRIVGQPSAAELSEFFRLLAGDEAEMRQDGGIEAVLRGKQVDSLFVTQRGVLVEALENPWEVTDRSEEADTGDGGVQAVNVVRMVQSGASAESIADALIAGAGEDPEVIADAFCEAYRTIYPAQDEPGAPDDESVPQLLAAAYRVGSKRRPPVDTFAEAFFLLPEEARAQVLTDFLINRDEGLHGLLLDQFAGLELADLGSKLDGAAFAELEAYVRDVVDTDLGTADELLPLVSSARDVSGARQSAAERIRAMIKGIGSLGGSSGGLAGELREELKSHEEMGLYVLTTLIEVEERSSRLSPLLAAWCDRIGQFVRAGDFDAATSQLGAGRKGATTQHKTELLEEALGEFVESEIELLIDSFQNEEQRPALVELLAGFGEPTTARLMQRLAQEESPVARRALIGILAGVAAVHPAPMARFFTAEQWYVVRNAVTVATKIGGTRWVGRIRPLTAHEDYRVVVESLRALASIAPQEATTELIGSLSHSNDRVVETALLLLRASNATNLEEELVAAMLNRRMDRARPEIAEVLFNLDTPGALRALEDMARHPLLIASHRRAARRAARTVLGSAA